MLVLDLLSAVAITKHWLLNQGINVIVGLLVARANERAKHFHDMEI